MQLFCLGPTGRQLSDIERCAEAALEARKRQEGATLADMYDPDNATFFPELAAAHRRLGEAVERAYGVDFEGDEERIVLRLLMCNGNWSE